MRSKQDKSPFVQWALGQGWLRDQFLSLLDVGASGGIDAFWRQFEPNLEAVGFDPLIAEVTRLGSNERNSRVQYEAGWVGDGAPRAFPPGANYCFPATSAAAAADISGRNYVQTHFNSGQEIAYSDRQLSLDTFLADKGLNRYDVLKVDTDGFDFFVLNGAKTLLTQGQLLVVECECQMHELRPGWPCFADIDQFMRKAGYRLVDINSWNYTRASLPGRFLYDIHAQTDGGQVQFSDALYMLDPSLDSDAMNRLKSDPVKLIKLVVLQAAFGYPDLAVSTLLAMRTHDALLNGIGVDAALDKLVPANPFGISTYKNYMELFEVDPDNFLASRWGRTNSKAPVASTESVSTIRLDQFKIEEDWKQNGASIESAGTGIMIKTPGAAWNYAAVIPLGRLGRFIPKEGNLFVRVCLRDPRGNPTISLYHPQSNTILGEIEVASSETPQVFDLLVDPTAVRAPDHLLIRNGGRQGQGSLVVEKIELVTLQDDFSW